MDAQVIIVGGGPAGAWLAYQLARMGVETLVLEKHALPRYKACGGALSLKAVNCLKAKDVWPHIPIDREISDFEFAYSRYSPIPFQYHGPPIRLVQRSQFDHALLHLASAAGARLIQCRVHQVSRGNRVMMVETNRGTFRAHYVVGADGAGSIVARSFKLNPGISFSAFQAEVPVDEYPGLAERFKDKIFLQWGRLPNGYGWVFPKRTGLSVGLGSRSSGPVLWGAFTSFLTELGVDWKRIEVHGHRIPVGGRLVVSGERFLLLGDAAYLAEPFTGEGIYYALRSAELAASCLVKGRIGRYSSLLRDEIYPELNWAMKMEQLFGRWPALFHHLVKRNPDIIEHFFAFIHGQASFHSFYRNILPQLINIRGS